MAFKLEIIKKREEFLKTSHQGIRILGDFFIFQYLKKESQDSSRFGFTVTKKTAKRAVIRNKMKRRLKEAVRSLENVPNGYDIVLIVRHKMLDAKYKDVLLSLNQLIKKAGM